MSSALIAAFAARRSVYGLANTSPIPDEQIVEIVSQALANTPSSFNVQSARAVVLLHDDHRKLWDIGDEAVKAELPGAYNSFAPKIAGFRGAYGSVLWFEDQSALDTLKGKNPGIQHMVKEWSEHSSGMHQYVVWTAFNQEGFGCNLQHYNFSDTFTRRVHETWSIPESWTLRAQLVFGQPTGAPLKEKTFVPIEQRLKVFGL